MKSETTSRQAMRPLQLELNLQTPSSAPRSTNGIFGRMIDGRRRDEPKIVANSLTLADAVARSGGNHCYYRRR